LDKGEVLINAESIGALITWYFIGFFRGADSFFLVCNLVGSRFVVPFCPVIGRISSVFVLS